MDSGGGPDWWLSSTFHSPSRRAQVIVNANAVSGLVTPAESVTLKTPRSTRHTTSAVKTMVRESDMVISTWSALPGAETSEQGDRTHLSDLA